MTHDVRRKCLSLLSILFAVAAWCEPAPTGGAIKPGDDFYMYANAAWLQTTQLPAGESKWTDRNQFDQNTRRQVVGLLEQASTHPSGSYQRKAADFFAAYLSEQDIEAKGVTPLKPAFRRIAAVRDRTDLSRLLGDELRVDVDPLYFAIFDSAQLFGLSVERTPHGGKTPVAYLLQGGLGMADRASYLDASAQAQEMRDSYRNNIARVLQLAGFDGSKERASAVMALEVEIAKRHATPEESAKDQNSDNRWTLAEFSLKAPGMDWPAFFSAANLTRQRDIIAWQPAAIQGEAALIASVPLDVWKNYLRFHLLDRYADVLPRVFARPLFTAQLTGAAGTAGPIGARQPTSREKRALDATNKAMPDAVGQMYVEQYFPPEAKVKAQRIAANVSGAFQARIEAVQWMTAATKALAIAKLKTMYFGVGYPETWADYSGLTIHSADALGNLRRAERWDYRNALAKLGRPTNPREWLIPPQRVAGVLNPLQNAYNFSAALLQPPKFDSHGADAANYGAIGAIFGHEISHFVDTLGSESDASGAMHQWWTEQDKKQFETSSDPLIQQFSSYRPFADLAVNGRQTLSENIADLGGLAAAFDAYRLSLGSKATDKDFVRQQDQVFFVAFASASRVKITDEAMRAQIATDPHAPQIFRVSTVRNFDAWYQAFNVSPGDRLYLEPQARVRIW
jgi:putative endopeptidase